jgi:hypothetical protein
MPTRKYAEESDEAPAARAREAAGKYGLEGTVSKRLMANSSMTGASNSTPTRSNVPGDRIDQAMTAHLQEAAIVEAVLADEDGLHCRLHVVVDAACL